MVVCQMGLVFGDAVSAGSGDGSSPPRASLGTPYLTAYEGMKESGSEIMQPHAVLISNSQARI